MLGGPRSVLILGGGISALSAAYHLSRRFPSSLVTVLERSGRWGGWIRSEEVQVQVGLNGDKETKVVLEAGPRTFRPGGKALVELINLLNLTPSLHIVPSTSPAAQNRFLHLPPKPGLTPLPSPKNFLSSPLGPTLVKAALSELFRGPNRPEEGEADSEEWDESVDAFLTRRFGTEVARTLGSSLVHGIYAADSRVLSARAAFPALLDAERRGSGRVIFGMLRRRPEGGEGEERYDLGDVGEQLKGASVFAFRGGSEVLVKRLVRELEAQGNVRLVSGRDVVSVGFDGKEFKVSIKPSESTPPTTPPQTTPPPPPPPPELTSTHLVSTLPLPTLSRLLDRTNPALSLPHLTANPSSSVSVVNLVFPPSERKIHPDGFGYLAPRPLEGYAAEEEGQDLGVLGTIFDSCVGNDPGAAERGLTKLTVMLGGPHPFTPTSDDAPLIQKLLRVLSHHLLPSSSSPPALPEPLIARVHHLKDCIPTYTVGHVRRIGELRRMLEKGPLEGRMEVIGAGVGGVGVPDCVKAGREVGRRW